MFAFAARAASVRVSRRLIVWVWLAVSACDRKSGEEGAPYLHTEVAANLPLRVAPSPDLAQGAAKLQVGGQAVRIVAAGEARVVFKGREKIGPARERVRLEIPAEGVVGHVDLELQDNVWRAVDASVAER